MKSKLENKQSYRQNHASKGYGERYSRTYEEGYYYYQWEYVERDLLKSILQKHGKNGRKRCLDFACGTGRITKVAEEVFPAVVGVDISTSMLECAKQACRVAKLHHIDITNERLEEELFDVVTAWRFFLNAEPPLRAEVLTKLHGLMSVDGVLIANVHLNSNSPLGWFYRFRNLLTGGSNSTLSLSQFEGVLKDHGFLVERVHRYGYLPRTGWLMGWVPKYFLKPVERIGNTFSSVFGYFAQAFIVECKKSDLAG